MKINIAIYFTIIVFLFLGCASKYVDTSTDLDKFQFIMTIRSNNVEFLREAAEKYNQKADVIRRNRNRSYLNSSIYHECRQWAYLLNLKAEMLEKGHFKLN